MELATKRAAQAGLTLGAAIGCFLYDVRSAVVAFTLCALLSLLVGCGADRSVTFGEDWDRSVRLDGDSMQPMALAVREAAAEIERELGLHTDVREDGETPVRFIEQSNNGSTFVRYVPGVFARVASIDIADRFEGDVGAVYMLAIHELLHAHMEAGADGLCAVEHDDREGSLMAEWWPRGEENRVRPIDERTRAIVCACAECPE